MMKKIYRGKLIEWSNGEEDDLLSIEGYDQQLAEIVYDDIERYGRYLSVSYYITDIPVSLDDLQLNLINTLYGIGDAEYGARYSEATGYLWTKDDITIGGHDLVSELLSYIGKWIHLEIEYNHDAKK